MATPTPGQLSLINSTWIDANSQFTINTLPDRLPDDLAIANSVLNILHCPIGARGRTFEPEYGSEWYYLLHEPIDHITAGRMTTAMIQCLQRWEPRIVLDFNNSYVQPDVMLPGYRVRIAAINSFTKKPFDLTFDEVVA